MAKRHKIDDLRDSEREIANRVVSEWVDSRDRLISNDHARVLADHIESAIESERRHVRDLRDVLDYAETMLAAGDVWSAEASAAVKNLRRRFPDHDAQ